MISLSISDFAEYMARSPDTREGALRDAKRRFLNIQGKERGERPPAYGNIEYTEARKAIRIVHDTKMPLTWLSTAAENLRLSIHEGMPKNKIRRFRNSARALQEYVNYPLKGDIDLVDSDYFSYSPTWADLTINIKPDMYIVRNGWDEFVKFNFSEVKILGVQKERYWEAYTQIMFMAMFENELIKGKFAAVSHHTHHQRNHYVNNINDIDLANLENICVEVVSLWPDVIV